MKQMRLQQQSRRNSKPNIILLKHEKHPTKPCSYHLPISQLRHNPDPATAENSLKLPTSHHRTPNHLPFLLPFIFFRDPFLSHEKLWWCSGYHIPKVFVHVALDCCTRVAKIYGRSQVRILPMVFVFLLVGSDSFTKRKRFFCGWGLLRECGTLDVRFKESICFLGH
jgi:hypothetical protein